MSCVISCAYINYSDGTASGPAASRRTCPPILWALGQAKQLPGRSQPVRLQAARAVCLWYPVLLAPRLINHLVRRWILWRSQDVEFAIKPVNALEQMLKQPKQAPRSDTVRCHLWRKDRVLGWRHGAKTAVCSEVGDSHKPKTQDPD